MKLLLAILCLIVSLYLLVRSYRNMQLNQALQLKKATLGYPNKKSISNKSGIPSLALMVVGFALLIPLPTNEAAADPVVMMTRNMPDNGNSTLLLNTPVELIESDSVYNNQPIIGTILVNELEYSVVISENKLFYLDIEENMYENNR